MENKNEEIKDGLYIPKKKPFFDLEPGIAYGIFFTGSFIIVPTVLAGYLPPIAIILCWLLFAFFLFTYDRYKHNHPKEFKDKYGPDDEIGAH